MYKMQEHNSVLFSSFNFIVFHFLLRKINWIRGCVVCSSVKFYFDICLNLSRKSVFMMESSHLKLADVFYNLSLSDFDGRHLSFPSVSTFIDDVSIRPANVITTSSVVLLLWKI